MAKPSLREQAIRFLARREYARSELEQRLAAKGGERDAIRAVLDALVAEGYLSDDRYARAVVAQKSGTPQSSRHRSELKAKGVGPRDIDSARRGNRALMTTRRCAHSGNAASVEPPADERDKARQVRFLQARGFALSAILQAPAKSGATCRARAKI